jgi:hypothetical protein
MMLPPACELRIRATDVYPNVNAVAGRGTLISLVGALLTITLVLACLMLIISAIVWAVSSASGNHQAASKARTGVWVAVGTATLAGTGVAWMNFLLGLGSSL